ncbi:MAG: MBL fold metallo-hydrolase [Bacillota bacterium]
MPTYARVLEGYRRALPILWRQACTGASASRHSAAWLMGNAGLLLRLGQALVAIDVVCPSELVGEAAADLCAALPTPDVTLVTHGHRDHCDPGLLRSVAGRGSLVVVPAGLAPLLKSYGVPRENLIETTAGEDLYAAGVALRALPARHATEVEPLGYMLEAGGLRVLHTGDNTGLNALGPSIPRERAPDLLAFSPWLDQEGPPGNPRHFANCLALLEAVRPRLALPVHLYELTCHTPGAMLRFVHMARWKEALLCRLPGMEFRLAGLGEEVAL